MEKTKPQQQAVNKPLEKKTKKTDKTKKTE